MSEFQADPWAHAIAIKKAGGEETIPRERVSQQNQHFFSACCDK